MRLRTILPAAAATVALLVAGCGAADDPVDEQTPAAPDGDFPVTVGDLTLESAPTRIISLSPTVTEMLFAVDAGDQVVAVDEYSNHPPEAPTTELSGFTPNVEVISTYDPDLVLLSYDPDGITDQLAELGIPTYLVSDSPTSLGEVYTQLVDVGALTGRMDEADRLVQQMSDEIDALTADLPTPEEPLTYYFELDSERYTYTAQTWLGELLAMAGLENIADDPDAFTMQLSVETIVDANPDLILLANTDLGESAETVAARDGWGGIEAVQQDRVVELDPDVASRWGPRIVDLLATVVDVVAEAP